MKVSQLVLGERYESKSGDEVREITSLVSDGTLRYIIIPIVTDAMEARRIQFVHKRAHEASRSDFAAWAARKAGTSTHRSADGKKFHNITKGPVG